MEDVRFAERPEDFAGYLVRWSIDLTGDSNTVHEEVLDDLICEFPRVDERIVGSAHRHSFYLCLQNKKGHSRHWDAVAHLDMETKERVVFDPGPVSFMSEAVFAPRPHSTEEGDGYLLVPVFRALENRSDILMLDAKDIASGPIATIKLPFRMNPSFHGNFHSGLIQ